MGQRQEVEVKATTPGPDCMVDKYNRFGPTTTPAYTMAPQLKPLGELMLANAAYPRLLREQ